MGAYFGSLEGLTQSIPKKIFSGMRRGILIGGLGGVVGFFLGQAFLLYLGDVFLHTAKELRQWGVPFSKVISWMVLGIFLGAIEGVRSFKIQKIKAGVIGGAVGGFFGGVALEFLPILLPGLAFADLMGLCLLGMMIGLSFGLVEDQFSTAVLRVLNGPFKGKEYLLVARSSLIGQAMKAEICLAGYLKIAPKEARIDTKKGQVFLRALMQPSKIKVNDLPLTDAPLAPEDIIQMGNAKMIFYYR